MAVLADMLGSRNIFFYNAYIPTTHEGKCFNDAASGLSLPLSRELVHKYYLCVGLLTTQVLLVLLSPNMAW